MEDDEIIIRLDVILALKKMSLQELADKVDVHVTNLSIFKNGRGKAIKTVTLMRICKVLGCTPNDIFEFRDPKKEPGKVKLNWEEINSGK